MFVFDQGQAQIALASLTETAAGTDGDAGFLNQLHGKIDRSHALSPLLRITRPNKHRRPGRFHFPANAAQALDQHIAAFLILLRLALYQLFAVAQGNDAGNLNGLENTVIIIALDGSQGADHLGIAGAEAQTPTGHVIAFAHGDCLDADFLGARHAQKTRRPITIETDITISEIVNDHETETPRQSHNLDEEIASTTVVLGLCG